MKVYTGVGARDTPDSVLTVMKYAAEALYRQGWTLRSGHAPGADQAFELGAGGRAEIYLPWPGYEQDEERGGVAVNAHYVQERAISEAFGMAADAHPNWSALGGGGRALHARNCHQILGRELLEPARFLICWTEKGHKRGGTATALTLAERYGVEVFNLWRNADRWRIERMIESVMNMETPTVDSSPSEREPEAPATLW